MIMLIVRFLCPMPASGPGYAEPAHEIKNDCIWREMKWQMKEN